MKLKIIFFLVLSLITFSETLNAQWKSCSSGLYADDLTSLISNGNYIFAG